MLSSLPMGEDLKISLRLIVPQENSEDVVVWINLNYLQKIRRSHLAYMLESLDMAQLVVSLTHSGQSQWR